MQVDALAVVEIKDLPVLINEYGRVTGTPAGQELAEVFAQISRDLQTETTPQHTAARIVAAAVHTVPGCDHAGISLVHRQGRIDTTAASDDIAALADTIQYQVGQGPCLEAIRDHESYLICDLLAEQRWPPRSWPRTRRSR